MLFVGTKLQDWLKVLDLCAFGLFTASVFYAVRRIKAWGFWGTMQDKAPAAWAIALPSIAQITGCTPEAVRAFLDSRFGRHFADEVNSHLYLGRDLEQSVHATIATWMGWTIKRITAKEYGIPRGMPYLTGFVIHCEIVDEQIAA